MSSSLSKNKSNKCKKHAIKKSQNVMTKIVQFKLSNSKVTISHFVLFLTNYIFKIFKFINICKSNFSLKFDRLLKNILKA